MFIFITGGYRSGRSNYALRRAAELGPPPWLYATSGNETDEAVRKRIERHRRDREAIWRTLPLPEDWRELLASPGLKGVGAAVFDGVVEWLEARLAKTPPGGEAALLDEVEVTADRLYRTKVPILVVSQEMGQAPHPTDPVGERLTHVVSSANQILAGRASGVVLMVSGVPLRVR